MSFFDQLRPFSRSLSIVLGSACCAWYLVVLLVFAFGAVQYHDADARDRYDGANFGLAVVSHLVVASVCGGWLAGSALARARNGVIAWLVLAPFFFGWFTVLEILRYASYLSAKAIHDSECDDGDADDVSGADCASRKRKRWFRAFLPESEGAHVAGGREASVGALLAMHALAVLFFPVQWMAAEMLCGELGSEQADAATWQEKEETMDRVEEDQEDEDENTLESEEEEEREETAETESTDETEDDTDTWTDEEE